MDALIVIFLLAGQRLALPAEAVRECLPLPALWRRPGLPDAVAGFFSLGGTILPVINLAVLFGLREVGRLDGVEQGGLYRPLLHVGACALLVDRLEGVARTVDAPPGLAADPWQHGCVSRHLFAGGAPVALLDPAMILRADEQQRVQRLAQDAAARAKDWAVAADADAR